MKDEDSPEFKEWLKRFHTKKTEGKIFVGWTPLLRFSLPNEYDTRFEWNKHLVLQLEVDAKAIETEVRKRCGQPEGDIQWG